MKIDATAFVGLAPKIASLLKEASAAYSAIKESGEEPSPEMISFLLLAKMDGWNPTVKGVAVLDEDTKSAGARFLAGVGCNLGKGLSNEREAV